MQIAKRVFWIKLKRDCIKGIIRNDTDKHAWPNDRVHESHKRSDIFLNGMGNYHLDYALLLKILQ